MKKKKRTNLNAKEFNKKLEYVKNFCEIKYNEEIKTPIGANAYIIDKISNIELTFKDPDNSFKPITYIFDKSCSANIHQKMGVDAWATLQKYYKIPHVANKEEAMEYFNSTVSGILYSSPYFTGERHYAYGYDMNSAFSWGMLQDMPKDTEKGPINLDKNKEPILRKVEKDEIGFSILGDLKYSGELATYDKPLTEYEVTPSKESQTVVPDSDHGGFSKVVVKGDDNLVASNIRKGVKIFGVTGTNEGGEDSPMVMGDVTYYGPSVELDDVAVYEK